MAILDFHHPWILVFGILGNIISVVVFLIPTSTFIQIYKKKSTMGFHSLPYVIALLSAILWLYYAFLVKNANLLISINSVGIVTETIYIIIFIVYASKEARNRAFKELVLSIGGFTATFLVSWFVFSTQVRISVVGWICVAFSIGVFASPLSVMFQVIRTKSVEFLPFYLSFFLTLNAIMWFGYGTLLKDLRIALPNVMGFLLALVQILLYLIYRKANPVVEESKNMAEHVVDVKIQETSNQEK